MYNPLETQYFSQDWLYHNTLKHSLTVALNGHIIELESLQRRQYTVEITKKTDTLYDVEVFRKDNNGELKNSLFLGITKEMIEAVMSVTILQDNTKSNKE